MDVSKMLCRLDATLKETMKQIDENAKGTVFVIGEDKKIVGIMTDGDIRRLLIDGHGIEERIEPYVNRNFVYARITDSQEEIRKKFNEAIKILPVLNEENEVINYAEYDQNLHISLVQPQLNGNEYVYLMDAFLSTWISSTGKYVTRFEENFAAYCGMKYGVATSNGTTALHLALTVLGIGKGDEVIVPDLTFAATINAVLYTGATPVIVDIEEDSWCISPQSIEAAITSKTKAIIPVHIYGQPCDMEKICSIAEKHNLYVVEDCAEAHGAEWKGKKVGSFGMISIFSFFGNKVITTGEGGICVTNDKNLETKMRIYRDHGMSKERRYYHEVVGFNYRMTNLQAAIGVAQLERIEQILAWRKELEIQYQNALKNIAGVSLQQDNLPGRKKIAWLVSILVDEKKRDLLMEELKRKGVDMRAFFIPLSEMDIYKEYARSCVISKKVAARGLNLPTSYEMRQNGVERIAEIIRDFLKK